MPERRTRLDPYGVMAGSSLIPVGVVSGLKYSGYDTQIVPPHEVTYSMLAEALAAVIGSIGTFVAKDPNLIRLSAGVGIGGIVLTVDDLIEKYVLKEETSSSGSSSGGGAETLDEYVKKQYGV